MTTLCVSAPSTTLLSLFTTLTPVKFNFLKFRNLYKNYVYSFYLRLPRNLSTNVIDNVADGAFNGLDKLKLL